MSDTPTAKPAQKPAQKPGGGKKGGDKREKKARGPHAGAGQPVPAPRLRGFYTETFSPLKIQTFTPMVPYVVFAVLVA